MRPNLSPTMPSDAASHAAAARVAASMLAAIAFRQSVRAYADLRAVTRDNF